MKITESKLRQIILEEIQMIELEELLVAEAAAMGITLTEEQKRSILQRFGRAGRRLVAPLAVGAALAGATALDAAVDNVGDERKAQIALNLATAQAAKETPEGKLKAISDFLFTPTGGNKWIWGEKGTTELFSSFNTDRGLIMVAPPEFSVLYQVYEDYQDIENNRKPQFGPGAKPAAPPAGDVVGSADYADMAKEKVSAGQVQSLPVRGLAGAVFVPMDNLDSTMHMENSNVSPEQLYVQYWDRFVGY